VENFNFIFENVGDHFLILLSLLVFEFKLRTLVLGSSMFEFKLREFRSAFFKCRVNRKEKFR